MMPGSIPGLIQSAHITTLIITIPFHRGGNLRFRKHSNSRRVRIKTQVSTTPKTHWCLWAPTSLTTTVHTTGQILLKERRWNNWKPVLFQSWNKCSPQLPTSWLPYISNRQEWHLNLFCTGAIKGVMHESIKRWTIPTFTVEVKWLLCYPPHFPEIVVHNINFLRPFTHSVVKSQGKGR